MKTHPISNYFGSNSNNNYKTMVPVPTAPVVVQEGESIVGNEGDKEEDKLSTKEGSKDKLKFLVPVHGAAHSMIPNQIPTSKQGPTATKAASEETRSKGTTNEGSKDSKCFGPNLNNNSMPVNPNNPTEKTNNSSTMVLVPVQAPTSLPEGTNGKDDWHKVKPHKKKQQRKLTFKKTPPREASKSGPMEVDQSVKDSTGGGNSPTKTVTMVTPPQGVTKKRKSLEDDKEDGQEEGAVGMEVEEEKTMERGAPKQPPKSVKQTSEKFISIRQTKAMSQWYLACISNKSVQGLDRDVNLTEEDLKPGSEFYGRFQWACDYSTRDKVGDDKKTVLHDPNHWFQTLTKVPNGDDLRKSEDPAKRKAARNVLEVGINLARSPMELFKDQFVCNNRKFGLDPSEETAELVAARA
jgi:hypothetical protein